MACWTICRHFQHQKEIMLLKFYQNPHYSCKFFQFSTQNSSTISKNIQVGFWNRHFYIQIHVGNTKMVVKKITCSRRWSYSIISNNVFRVVHVFRLNVVNCRDIAVKSASWFNVCILFLNLNGDAKCNKIP